MKKKLFTIVLSVVMILGSVSVAFAGETKPTVKITAPSKFKVGETAEFSVATTPGNKGGTQVVGISDFSNLDAIEKLEYFEVKDNQWYELKGLEFGPKEGFPLGNFESKFRVKFKKAGEYNFNIKIKDVTTNKILAESAARFVCIDKVKPTVIINIPETFNVGEATEFSVATTGGDFTGTNVIGTGDFSNPDAIEKLEYFEVKDNQWYELKDVEFGPEGGFPLGDFESKFRVTFKEAGDFFMTVNILTATDDKTELASKTASVKVVNSVITDPDNPGEPTDKPSDNNQNNENNSTEKNDGTPKTGDTGSMMALAIMALIATSGIAGVTVISRRRKA